MKICATDKKEARVRKVTWLPVAFIDHKSDVMAKVSERFLKQSHFHASSKGIIVSLLSFWSMLQR